MVNYPQDDWSEKLLMTGFAANKNDSASTEFSPFFARSDLHPRMGFDVVDLSDITARDQINKKKDIDFYEAIQSILKYTQKFLTKAQTSQLNQANKHRKEVSYDIGDEVWLFTKNISTNQLSKKIYHKIIGFFEVIRTKNISLQL